MDIAYDERFGGLVPQTAFPLPLGKLRTPTKSATPAWWEELLDFAEKFVGLTPEQLNTELGRIPKKFQLGNPKNQFLASLHADIIVGMRFYSQYSLEEENLELFPKGLKRLVETYRREVLQAVQLARAEDWTQVAVQEFSQALSRCRSLCDATRRGHLAPSRENLWFRLADVEKTMKDTRGMVGLVNYTHVYETLKSEAVSEEA